jgi:hypothetical protein
MRQRAKRAESSHSIRDASTRSLLRLLLPPHFHFKPRWMKRVNTSKTRHRAFFYELSDEWVFSLWNGEHELYYRAIIVTTMSAV